MDRDVALNLNTKLSAINTALQNIVNGIVNSAEISRSVPSGDQRSAPAEDLVEEPEEPEAPAEDPETRTKK